MILLKDWPFYLIALFATGCAIMAQARGIELPSRVIGLWVCTAVFWLGPLMLIVGRLQMKRYYAFTIDVGGPTGVLVPVYFYKTAPDSSSQDVIAGRLLQVVSATYVKWAPYFRRTDAFAEPPPPNVVFKNLTIVFRALPFESHRYSGLLAGLTFPGRAVHVGYDTTVHSSFADTALGHELGHYILDKIGDDPAEENLAKIAKEYGVPY